MHDWRSRLHDPTPDYPLPAYLQSACETAVAVINPSLSDAGKPPTSVLLLGPHESGKSLLTSRIIHTLRSNCKKDLLVVHLRGLLHSTPQRAWRYVAACLHSHAQIGHKEDLQRAGVDECLGVISVALSKIRECGIVILFVLDDFDRFVTGSDGMSQTVLYSLLNFLQDRAMRAACVAMTACIDVTDGLEKRVKSRFVHRQIVVPLPKTADDVINWISAVMSNDGAGVGLKKSQTNRKKTPKKVSKRKRPDHPEERQGEEQPRSDEEKLQEVILKFLKNNRCCDAIEKKMSRSRVVGPILRAVECAIDTLLVGDENSGVFLNKDTGKALPKAWDMLERQLEPRDSGVEAMKSFTVLEISLLVSLRKLEAHSDKNDAKANIVFGDVFRNYESMNVTESRGFVETRDGEPTLPRGVAEKAWERLVESGLVVRVGHGPREMRICSLGVAGREVDFALERHPVASTTLQRWGRLPIS